MPHWADARARAVVNPLVRELDRLPPMPAAVSCPNDDLLQLALLLSYLHHCTLTIRVELCGCETATDGPVDRIAARGTEPRVIADLRRLKRCQ